MSTGSHEWNFSLDAKLICYELKTETLPTVLHNYSCLVSFEWLIELLAKMFFSFHKRISEIQATII